MTLPDHSEAAQERRRSLETVKSAVAKCDEMTHESHHLTVQLEKEQAMKAAQESLKALNEDRQLSAQQKRDQLEQERLAHLEQEQQSHAHKMEHAQELRDRHLAEITAHQRNH